MNIINHSDLKKIQLGILETVHEFCITNNISYSLSYGTLLGCIRHKGYIPWDDDIDIMMPRSDYERFIQEFNHTDYEVIDYNFNKDYWLPYAKVLDKNTLLRENTNLPIMLGVNIDIFPIDNIPNNYFSYNYNCLKKKFYNILHTLKIVKINKNRSFIKNSVLWVTQLLLSYIPMNFIVAKLNYISTLHNSHDTLRKGIITPTDCTYKKCMPSDVFSNYIDGTFENKTFKIIKEYDTFLSIVYGDYMKVPPKDKQISLHSFKAYSVP